MPIIFLGHKNMQIIWKSQKLFAPNLKVTKTMSIVYYVATAIVTIHWMDHHSHQLKNWHRNVNGWNILRQQIFSPEMLQLLVFSVVSHSILVFTIHYVLMCNRLLNSFLKWKSPVMRSQWQPKVQFQLNLLPLPLFWIFLSRQNFQHIYLN